MNEADTCRTYILPNLKASGLHVKVNGLWELQSPSLHFGDATQSASGDASQVAPAFWVPFGR
ncbi:MAG: hypothetical protein M3R47_16890 [Chloroflexota bacterium]|nr:hypothetical protein [Chloroflexota bacterium]